MDWYLLDNYTLSLYSTDWCPDCVRFKGVLHVMGVSFKEFDMDHDLEAKARLKAAVGDKYGVPYLEIEGKGFIRGWHEEAPGRWDETVFEKEVKTLLA